MATKKLFAYLTMIFIFTLLITSVSAITGKIGNGRMVLTAETGDVIDRTIRVINDNDVALNISLFPTGDLENDTIIIDNNFVLNPGEEKNARFKMYLQKPGRFNNRINVQFTPVNGKNGVGLASQIILTVTGDALSDEEFVELKGDDQKTEPFEVLTNIFSDESGESKIKPPQTILFISTVVLIVILGILYYLYKNKKRGGKKSGEGNRSKK